MTSDRSGNLPASASASPSASASSPGLPPFFAMIAMLGLLSCVGPATIDAYLPAFDAIGQTFGATPQAVQQTLGVYMFAYAAMMLFHGSLSDSFGRRRIVCVSLAVYLAGSLCAAFAPNFETLLTARVVQGLSSGAGIVVGQAIIKDCYDGVAARKAMSYVLVIFNISPALAPILGGYLIVHQGWRSVFVAMAALALAAMWLCMMRLPETLLPAQRQPFSWRTLLLNYRRIACDRQFAGMALSFGFLFAGQAFIIGAAPDLIFNVLALQATDFMYLFVPLVAGAMSGALFSARMSHRLSSRSMILIAYALMGGSTLAGVLYQLVSAAATPLWTIAPLAVFICGLAMSVPGMTMQVLARFPQLTGMAASVLGFVQVMFFSVISGWCVPLVYGRPDWLAVALLACVCASAAGWMLMDRYAVSRPANVRLLRARANTTEHTD